MHTEIVFKMTDSELQKQSLQWKPHKTWMQVGLKDSHMKEGLHKSWIWLGERQIETVSQLSFKEGRDKKVLGEWDFPCSKMWIRKESFLQKPTFWYYSKTSNW